MAIDAPAINPARCALKTAEAVAAQQLAQSRRIMSMATIARYPDKFDAAVPMAGYPENRTGFATRRIESTCINDSRPSWTGT